MSGTGTHSGGLGGAIKKGVGLVHGTGEAIRGNVNAAVDNAAGDRASGAKNEAIASRGADEIDHGYHHVPGTGVGVTPTDTAGERQQRAAQGEYSTQPLDGSTNYGPHSTNTGNKLDPRYDSDLDHRGAQVDGSSSVFHHESRRANSEDVDLEPRSGLEPKSRYDSDQDHCLRSATRDVDHGTRHSKETARDWVVDSVQDHGSGTGSTLQRQQPGYGAPHPVHRSSTMNHFDPRMPSEHFHIHRKSPTSRCPQHRGSEPTSYFLDPNEDIETHPTGPLSHQLVRSHEQEAQDEPRCEGGRWLSNRDDVPYQHQQH